MSSKRSGYHNGNSGEVWIAGKKVGTCNKGEVKTKYNYEEVDNPEVPGGKIRVLTGKINEISVSYKSTGTEEEIDMFNLDEDITVIMNDANINGTKKRRVKCDGVTFDEETLISFEKGKVKEITLNGQAETVTDLK
ncbi:hypothetical protein [uncultured Fusobacterium sp.]|mgnify:CR=1 FL=1|uniref:hypothetical protein n=1 Tax=uncultured Fusobacterium sp. TaxID=159267 RepID=UPI0025FD6581|nr:hypothetical protein [uncultured Fusobacterium sp.]